MVHYFLRVSSLSPSPMVSGRSGSSRHIRKPALKNLVTSETADVQFLLCGVPGRGVPAPLTPPLAPPLEVFIYSELSVPGTVVSRERSCFFAVYIVGQL